MHRNVTPHVKVAESFLPRHISEKYAVIFQLSHQQIYLSPVLYFNQVDDSPLSRANNFVVLMRKQKLQVRHNLFFYASSPCFFHHRPPAQ